MFQVNLIKDLALVFTYMVIVGNHKVAAQVSVIMRDFKINHSIK